MAAAAVGAGYKEMPNSTAEATQRLGQRHGRVRMHIMVERRTSAVVGRDWAALAVDRHDERDRGRLLRKGGRGAHDGIWSSLPGVTVGPVWRSKIWCTDGVDGRTSLANLLDLALANFEALTTGSTESLSKPGRAPGPS